MKNIRLYVKSVREYFSLSKSEREVYGFYKVPFSLPWSIYNEEDGWNAFYKRIAKEYPIQYFFRVWLFSYRNPVYAFIMHKICWPLDSIRAYITNFLDPCCPRWRKTLPRHKYSDITNIIVDSNFNLILDFYYEEVKNGHVDWQADEKHREFYDTLINAVEWIENGQKILNKKSIDALTAATEDLILKDKPYKERYSEYDDIEKQIDDKKTEILKWMIENREGFWT
jgi:hypothetical protein